MVLALLLMRAMLGEPDKSFILVQSQVEAYMLTLFPSAFRNGLWAIDLPIDTSSWDPLPYTHTRKAILLEDFRIPWSQRGRPEQYSAPIFHDFIESADLNDGGIGSRIEPIHGIHELDKLAGNGSIGMYNSQLRLTALTELFVL